MEGVVGYALFVYQNMAAEKQLEDIIGIYVEIVGSINSVYFSYYICGSLKYIILLENKLIYIYIYIYIYI